MGQVKQINTPTNTPTQKQIEEMAKDLCHLSCTCEECQNVSDLRKHNCNAKKYAKRAYEAGYRKQSEWISVEERLPEDNDTRVLIYLVDKRMIHTQMDTDRFVKGKWVRWGSCVTHWMPLPEAPKMEGGEA